MVRAMTMAGQTLDSMPTDRPDRMTVAGPVLVDLAMSFTGCVACR